MKELYKVRNINISLLDKTTYEPLLDIPCEFGKIIDKEGIIFLETHIFNEDYFAKFISDEIMGSPATVKMSSFDGIAIEAPYMAIVGCTTKESKVTLKCIDHIKVYEEDTIYDIKKSEDPEMLASQLLRVDLWGLDLLITPNLTTMLIVSDAAFESEFYTDGGNRETYINFPCNKEVAHNILTEDLFEAFRYSLIGYLSLINGARVQISKEYYNGFSKIYSYDRIENLSRSYYTCGNAKLVRFSPILFEFDNYVRWNQVLNLNKFVHHICTAQQVLICEDSSFILILAFEGLCKNYLELQSEEKVKKYVIPLSSFDEIEKELIEVLNHYEIPSEALVKYKEGIAKLNVLNLATYKFRLLLNDLNIPETKVVKGLIRRVRSTLVHDAKLKEYTDYQLLSELIREAILRLICSSIERHSELGDNAISGMPENLPFQEFIKEKKLNITEKPIFDKFDTRIKLRITKGRTEN
jgi:hypothetical protein